MRKTFKYIIAAASLFLSTAVFAQTRPSIMADGDTDPYAGLKVFKNSVLNPDGTATITLDTYVTGKAEGTSVSKPVNAVLVLDLSGSMGQEVKEEALDTEKGKAKGHYCYYDGDTRYLLWNDNGTWKRSQFNKDENYKTFSNAPSKTYITRLGMLQDACKVFAELLYNDCTSESGSGTQHKLRIITYKGEDKASSATEAFALSVMNVDNYNSAISKINSFHPQNGTPADRGMNKAASTSFDENSVRIVLHVTDGQPGQYTFEYDKAANVVKDAQTLKNASAKVYSISIYDFGTGDAADRMKAYMDHSSSNYSNAGATATGRYWDRDESKYMYSDITYTGTKDKSGFYLTVTDPNSLKETFKDIVGSAINEAADCKDITSKSVVLDVMSPDYQIPSNASNIKIYRVPYTDKTSETANPNGFPAVTEEYRYNVTPTIEEYRDTKGNVCQALKITGFDYSANWCGPTIVTDKTTHLKTITAHGYKIHIVFNVEPTDNGEGGVTSTNNADSGIMVDGNVVKNYPRQVDKVMNSMDLKIVKTGLAAGATAIYSVSDGTNSWIVSLTSESDGAEAKAILRVPFHNDENNIISYTVSELDWNYTSSAATKSIAKPLYKTVATVEELLNSSDPESLKDNIFTFGSTSSSSIGAKYRDESATPNNIFE